MDVAWVFFPREEDIGNPGHKTRPSLVLEIGDYDGKCYVLCAYGTSRVNKLWRRGDDLFVENYVDIGTMGLSTATRFDLDRLMWLPWSEQYFVPPPGIETTNPVYGHTPQDIQSMLRSILRDRHRRGLLTWPWDTFSTGLPED